MQTSVWLFHKFYRVLVGKTGLLRTLVLSIALLGVTPLTAAGQVNGKITLAPSVDWQGTYFNNTDLQGAPVLVRDDTDINFDWGNGSPDPHVRANNFSARWIRSVFFNAGNYRFLAHADDAVRVWLDDWLVIDQWHGFSNTTYSDTFEDVGAGWHTVKVEYAEYSANAFVHIWWQPLIANWKGEYFNNADLSGAPILVRNDASINFNWGNGSPDPRIQADNFSTRWTRVVNFNDGDYRFYVNADDAVRVWLDNWLLIDHWQVSSGVLYTATFHDMGAGPHTVKVEYAEYTRLAHVHVWWQQLPVQFTLWKGEYFNNTNLSGDPAIVRNDPAINFSWVNSSPARAIHADNFSVRWTRSVYFQRGNYLFVAVVDDGMRLYLDGNLIMDHWADGNSSYSTLVFIPAGYHRVRMEYYEDQGMAKAQLTWNQLG